VSTEKAVANHGHAECECGHDPNRDHGANVRIFDEWMRFAIAWQQVPEKDAADNNQDRPANDQKHIGSSSLVWSAMRRLSVCVFCALRVLRFGPTHRKNPSKPEDGEEKRQ
jgi:hypothetical protein